ncbi:MAG: biotin--[acetyl-CoA-carboxylase] ligase [Patulibacter sp.]|nr:biotin--[acetyl-CoA-carboxylase] ligase [Patulibacter sp.]
MNGAPRPLGTPRHALAETGSTNDEARRLAREGAPHGTTVTADAQTAGRGRQGRPWVVPPGQALLVSVVLRDLPHFAALPLAVAVAVAETVGDDARIKWPNDVVRVEQAGELRKFAGILCEGRPTDGWAVAGIGLNVAVDVAALPPEVAARAASMGLGPDDREAVLARLLDRLAVAIGWDPATLLERWARRDVLWGRTVRWELPGAGGGGSGEAVGVDDAGRLLVRQAGGETARLDAGEVHLVRAPAA